MTAPDWTDAAIDALVAECDEFDEAAEGQPWLPRHFRDDVTGHDSETLAALANRAEEERSRLLSALRWLRERARLDDREQGVVNRMRAVEPYRRTSFEADLLAIIDRLTGRQP